MQVIFLYKLRNRSSLYTHFFLKILAKNRNNRPWTETRLLETDLEVFFSLTGTKTDDTQIE